MRALEPPCPRGSAQWLTDFADTQVYDNATMNADGALPDCIPFYGHGNTDAVCVDIGGVSPGGGALCGPRAPRHGCVHTPLPTPLRRTPAGPWVGDRCLVHHGLVQ